jgi:hypothetical protein
MRICYHPTVLGFHGAGIARFCINERKGSARSSERALF